MNRGNVLGQCLARDESNGRSELERCLADAYPSNSQCEADIAIRDRDCVGVKIKHQFS
jgi:hypothetical protein